MFSEISTFYPLASRADHSKRPIPINIHIYTKLQYLSVHANIICYDLSEHLGNCLDKTSDV